MAEHPTASSDGLPIPPPPPPGTLNFNSQATDPPRWPAATNPIDELRHDFGRPDAPPLPDVALQGGPLVRYDGHVREMGSYQQSGTIKLEGDTITQSLGRAGKTAEYSLDQLAAHSKDPEFFKATMRYAAERGDSVKIDVHDGVSRVTDPVLEHLLPRDIPLREPILRASVMHDIDPRLLAAVGTQETHLGADYLGATPDHYKATHRGDVEKDSPLGHGYGPFQLDDRSHSPGELQRAASDPYFAADKAASMLADNIAAAKKAGSTDPVSDALHNYNAGQLSTPSSTTDWGPGIGSLPYEQSTMRFYGEIEASASQSWNRSQSQGAQSH